ncbi:MAG: glycine--tRNA ligase subunit beta, partial [Candidatus Cloacimonetes bacterium]|nr:glycine--tRNA ligase subunit beta [Candidatus Cloacimonadota bacterium]
VEINNINEYEKKLEYVFVVPNRNERKARIEKQLHTLFRNNDEGIILDKNLLETVIDLVEYPTAVVAKFDRKYLELPELVVTSTLSEHQKYFAVKDKNGNVTNKFVFISNGDEKYSDLIKQGNEKVVKARLEDAEFYYKEDTKQPLENYVPKLKEVTFQEKLGSLFEKTERIKKLTEYLCTELNLNKTIKDNSIRAAHLCKADLVTMMLGEKEYTKLQGYIGSEYARKSGENCDVAKAIEEHYKSGGYYKNLSKVGAIVAIADKMDTVCGIIGVNMIPTGSKDPFALRRAGNGIVQIIANQNFEIDLHKLIDEAFNQLDTKLSEPEHNKNIVYDFFKQRVNWLLKQRGI